MAAIMTFGATFANAGIIVAGRTADQPCTTQSSDRTGIIVAGLAGTGTGIIVAGLAGTGIIVAGLAGTGIIVAGATDSPCTTTTESRTGIIVAG